MPACADTVNVTDVPAQPDRSAGSAAGMVGTGFTVIVPLAVVLVHPVEFVTDTLYVVLFTGKVAVPL
jgi:hypothetical protein